VGCLADQARVQKLDFVIVAEKARVLYSHGFLPICSSLKFSLGA
jgi:hypothetical protein